MSTINVDTTVTTINVVTTGIQGPSGPRGADGPAGEIDPTIIADINTRIEDLDNEVDLIKPQIDALSENKLDKVDYVQHFKGLHNSYAELVAAIPVGIDGDYAHIKASQSFPRLEAIWSGTVGVWNITSANVGINTDAVPEGSSNLYFKTERVLASLLSGLNTGLDVAITSSDSIIQGLGKIQGQLNNFVLPATIWVPISSVATVQSSVSINNIEVARINGMLWIRGSFQLNANVGAADFITITDNNYKTIVPNAADFNFNRLANITVFTNETPTTINYRISANRLTHTIQGYSGFGITNSQMIIQPTCIGKLVIQ